MKKYFTFAALVVFTLCIASEAHAQVKWVSSSKSSKGGYYRDTSNDGNAYNNANYLGYND